MTSRKALQATALIVCFMCLLPVGYGAGDGGHIVYPVREGSPGPAVFSHRVHAGGKAGYECGICHASATAKTGGAAMDTVHRNQVCGTCHDGRSKRPRGQLPAAPIRNCAACHMPDTDIVIKLNRMDPVAFSHIRHLASDTRVKVSRPAGFSCGDCHPALFERASTGQIGMELPHVSGGCAECHNGKDRADGMPTAFRADTRCLTCHKSPA